MKPVNFDDYLNKSCNFTEELASEPNGIVLFEQTILQIQNDGQKINGGIKMQGTKENLYDCFEGLIQKYEECENKVNTCLTNLKTEHIHKMNYSEQKRIITQQMKTAKNKFTIATIGEFKAGKSTTINTLLHLRGDAGLSCQFQPDTAKAIRILKKNENQSYEAEVLFLEGSGYAAEQMSWVEAKKFTSQVALNENPKLKRKADQIDEVRYYLDLDILDRCNFLDLPGTGFDSRHNRVTEAKINECDAVFWIMSNTEEANNETIKNLQMIKHKIIPIINIWYNPDTGEEAGDFTFEEMKENLLYNFKAYLGGNEMVRYCAKAIEIALEKVAEDDADMEEAFEDNEGDIWGYNAMQERLHDLVYGEGVDLEEDKKHRMIDNVLEACSDMNQKLDGIIAEVKNVKSELDIDKRSNVLVKQKITNAFNLNQLQIKDVASNAVDFIITRITEASELFIDEKMASTKLKVVLRSITKKGKAKLEKEYQDEYMTKYLEIDKKEDGHTWLESVMSEYKEDLTSIFDNEYAKAGLDFGDMGKAVNSDIKLDLKFFHTISENMTIAFEQMLKDSLPVIISGILLYIPGHEVVDAFLLLSSLTGKQISTAEDRLDKRVGQAKRRARLSVSFQRLRLIDSFKKLGRQYNTLYKESLSKKLALENASIDQLVEAAESIFSIQKDLEEYYDGFKSDMLAINGGEQYD